MTTVLKLFTVPFLVLMFLSCSKKETNSPTDLSTPKVLTDSVGAITEISASCYITISSEGKGPISEAGIVWGLNTNPTTTSNKLLAANKINGSYNISLTGLAENTDYFVRAFASNSNGTSYGNQLIFTTKKSPELPKLILDSFTNISKNSATTNSTIISEGTSPVLAAGVVWGLNVNPTVLDNKIPTSGIRTGSFTSNLTGLAMGTTYHVRSFATNALGTAYSENKTFVTLSPDLPEVGLPTLSEIKANSVKASFNLINDGGGQISGIGVCWSTNQNPTILSNTANGSSITVFNLNPSTTYFMRAFATNEAGTSYSIQVQFNTESINNIKLLLTGGSRNTWKLDPAPGAASVTAGTETNPTEYYAGGPLAPCQINDSYTFTINDSIYANFSGDALINDALGSYYCSGYGNFSGTFSFGPVVGSGAGFAQIVLTTPGKQFEGLTLDKQFIGIMDNVQNVYRILEISSTKMVLRVGDGSGPVQTLKFVPK